MKNAKVYPSESFPVYSISGLKPGRVNRVTFCPGQVGLTQILYWIMCVNNDIWYLSMLDDKVSPDSPRDTSMDWLHN